MHSIIGYIFGHSVHFLRVEEHVQLLLSEKKIVNYGCLDTQKQAGKKSWQVDASGTTFTST